MTAPKAVPPLHLRARTVPAAMADDLGGWHVDKKPGVDPVRFTASDLYRLLVKHNIVDADAMARTLRAVRQHRGQPFDVPAQEARLDDLGRRIRSEAARHGIEIT